MGAIAMGQAAEELEETLKKHIKEGVPLPLLQKKLDNLNVTWQKTQPFFL